MNKQNTIKLLIIILALSILIIFLMKIKPTNDKIIYNEIDIKNYIILLKINKNYKIYTNIDNLKYIKNGKEKNILISLQNESLNINDIIKNNTKEEKYDSNKVIIKYYFNEKYVNKNFNIIKCSNNDIYLLDNTKNIKNICE